MAETLSIVGWDRFQHYKDRDPPWIKLYRDLLTTESWVLGTDLSRLVQVASLLLAARYTNKIPLQWKLLRKVASLDCSEKEFLSAVSHLCATKFFEIHSLPDQPAELAHPASAALATCNTETEEKEKEEKSREDAHAREPLPDGLDLESWNRWEAYRSSIRKPIKPASMLAAQRKLAGYGADQAVVVEHTIAQGYTGLWEPKGAANGKPKLTWKPPPDEPEAASA